MPPVATARTRIRRLPDRGHYDFATITAIIDAAYLCHIAFQWDGSVHSLPTAHWRDGDYLYIHGAKASRLLAALVAGEASVTIAHVDGLVFARSAFHHSMNYRSVVIYGRFEPAPESDKSAALAAFIERLAPGRWEQLRPASAKELNATSVLRIPLHEASAKIRNWGVKDDEEDMVWPVWAGVVPLQLRYGAAETDALSVVSQPPDNLPKER
ncbi:MAG TPA: pyridoxamine 5'-phosphate oxidase family protein [Rhodocyclaceae bacterium]|nr:pyridoxamine 5'-phosphate oxidase family protein [Rhodocyclaceae bacterium]